jgi:CBS domain containing-hemolysin-like protein
MTPRVNIEALSLQTTLKEALEFYLSHTHSRIPIYENDIDNIKFFITARDLIFHFKNTDLTKKLSQINLKKVIKVPINQKISTLFNMFQKTHKVMAIVIDEFG